jgi:hypothetical protein
VAIAATYFTAGMGSDFAVTWLSQTSVAATEGFSAATINAVAAIGGGAAAGFTSGLIMSDGNMNSAFRGGLSGAITGGIFSAIGSNFSGGTPGSYAAHAGAGCLSAVMSGGKCGQGAVSQLFSKYATVEWHANYLTAAIVGGTVSAIGGGKFGNGAITGAFGYLFNACGQDPQGCLKWGTAIGTAAGVGVAAGCNIGTAGACVLANPAIVASGTGVGIAAGALADTIGNVVNGNSWLSPNPTTVYQLVSNVDDSVWKYGITDQADPTGRYTQSYYSAFNVTMQPIATFESRAPARMLEIGLCTAYAISHDGKLPVLSKRC